MTNAMPAHAVHEPIAAPRSSGGKLDDDHRQRARRQQRAEDALQRAPGDEHLDRSAPARRRRSTTPKPATPSAKIRRSP